jgi:protease-4
MPGHVILAQPGTLTGSIGIFSGKFVTGGTFAKLGANMETVKSGKFADMNSPMRPYNAEEREKVEDQMQHFYDMFVEKVAQARKRTPAAIDAVAQGRVWTGKQAKGIGLVDQLGGLQEAITVARERAKIPADHEIDLVIYPPKRTFFEALSEPFGRSDEGSMSATDGLAASAFLRMLKPAERRALADLTAPFRLLQRGEPLALMPYVFLH